MVVLCETELHTQHHNQSGHGPVQNGERILCAVFEGAQLEGGKLYQKSFESNALKNNNLSVCRVDYTTRAEFEVHVVRGQPVLGGGMTFAEEIRRISYGYGNPVEMKKALCVHDRVDPDDYEGHATLAYAASIQEIRNPTTKGSICHRIRGDLAQLMQPIFPLNDIPFRALQPAGSALAQNSAADAEPAVDGEQQ